MQTEKDDFRRNQMLGTYLTRAEKKLAINVARALGITASNLLREALFDYLMKLQIEAADDY
jgi:hypothetical protein